jgi:hypothetical protein
MTAKGLHPTQIMPKHIKCMATKGRQRNQSTQRGSLSCTASIPAHESNQRTRVVVKRENVLMESFFINLRSDGLRMMTVRIPYATANLSFPPSSIPPPVRNRRWRRTLSLLSRQSKYVGPLPELSL